MFSLPVTRIHLVMVYPLRYVIIKVEVISTPPSQCFLSRYLWLFQYSSSRVFSYPLPLQRFDCVEPLNYRHPYSFMLLTFHVYLPYFLCKIQKPSKSLSSYCSSFRFNLRCFSAYSYMFYPFAIQ